MACRPSLFVRPFWKAINTFSFGRGETTHIIQTGSFWAYPSLYPFLHNPSAQYVQIVTVSPKCGWIKTCTVSSLTPNRDTTAVCAAISWHKNGCLQHTEQSMWSGQWGSKLCIMHFDPFLRLWKSTLESTVTNMNLNWAQLLSSISPFQWQRLFQEHKNLSRNSRPFSAFRSDEPVSNLCPCSPKVLPPELGLSGGPATIGVESAVLCWLLNWFLLISLFGIGMWFKQLRCSWIPESSLKMSM